MKSKQRFSIGVVVAILFSTTMISNPATASGEQNTGADNVTATKSSNLPYEDVVISTRQATDKDFPVTPKVGESKTVVYSDKIVRVQRITASCSMAYTAYNPYKSDNRIKANFDATRSAGCSGYLSVGGFVSRTNYGGGEVIEGVSYTKVYPGMSIGFRAVTDTCQTGENRPWHSAVGTARSNKFTLPCNFVW